MCFSATASFTAAAVTGGIGAMTLSSTVRRQEYRALALAAFPVLFALQQLVEGFLWLDLAAPAPGAWHGFLVHAFQGYAEVFWPIFAPLAVLLMERQPWRRHLMLVCLAVGVALSMYLLAKMIAHPYAASVGDGHIVYRNDAQYPTGIEVPYVLATTVSLLLSSHRAVQILGAVIMAGFAVAWVSFHHAYISVWCFFAAMASVLVYLQISGKLEPAATTRTA
jgi:hypothetical protein